MGIIIVPPATPWIPHIGLCEVHAKDGVHGPNSSHVKSESLRYCPSISSYGLEVHALRLQKNPEGFAWIQQLTRKVSRGGHITVTVVGLTVQAHVCVQRGQILL